MGDSKSCIDLIFTDQPNLFLESGVHPALQEQCHHQIILGEPSIKSPSPPPYPGRIWHYDRANATAIQKSIKLFGWREFLNECTSPNKQVELLNETLLNIFHNFIPNKEVTVRPRQALWIIHSIKNSILKKNRAYKRFAENDQPVEGQMKMNEMEQQTTKLVEDSK